MKKCNKEGLPLDAKDWTLEDWKDLYRSIERAKKKIRNRHKGKPDGGKPDGQTQQLPAM